eukprot:jgi/Hompol1/2793/HPOL_000385-RA
MAVSTPNLLLSLFSASLVMLTAGSAYCFGVYGTQLSEVLKLSQSQTAFVAACGNSGIYISGPLVGHRSSVFFLIGGSLIFAGYGTISLAFTGAIPRPHYLLLALVFLCVGIGRNWPVSQRGFAVGITVGFFGLSAFFFTSTGTWLFQSKNPATGARILDVGAFLWFLAGCCLVFNVFAAVTLRDMTAAARTEEEASLLRNDELAQDDAQQQQQQRHRETDLALPSSRRISSLSNRTTSSFASTNSLDVSDPFLDGIPEDPIGNAFSSQDQMMEAQAEMQDSWPPSSVLQNTESQVPIELEDISCFTYTDAYLLAFSMFVIVGIGLMYTNNVSAILVSLAPADKDASDPLVQDTQRLHVILLSILGFIARIVTGIVSDTLHRTFGVSRTVWSALGAILMTLACAIMTVAESFQAVLLASIMAGLAYGAVWTITPVLVGEYFGFQRFGSNWGWMTMVPAFGGQFFSLIFGWVYDSGRKSHEALVCKGTHCFQPTFVWSVWWCVACLIATGILNYRRARVSHV